MVFGPGQAEAAVQQSDVWIWQMVCVKPKGFLEVLASEPFSHKCCCVLLLSTGGLLKGQHESAGVQSLCRGQHPRP